MPRSKFTSADYCEDTALSCDGCGWSGAAREAAERQRADFVAVRCPCCDRTIATVLPDAVERVSPATAYYDFFEAPLTCRRCGWSGRGRQWSTETNSGGELFDVYCPKCDERRTFVSVPTHGQIRDAATAGDRRASAELPSLDRREAAVKRTASSLLRDPAELPEVEGDELELLWDFVAGAEGRGYFTVIRHGDRELWCETAFWEAGDRFAEVFTILRRRYGWRLVALTPTDRSLPWLGGDHFTLDYRRAAAGLTNVERVPGSVIQTAGGLIRGWGPVELTRFGHRRPRSPLPRAAPGRARGLARARAMRAAEHGGRRAAREMGRPRVPRHDGPGRARGLRGPPSARLRSRGRCADGSWS